MALFGFSVHDSMQSSFDGITSGAWAMGNMQPIGQMGPIVLKS
jgi:hypothetical protein